MQPPARPKRAFVWLALACSLLGACSTSPYGRAQLTAPQPLSAVYSEVNMRLHLVTSADAAYPCVESECEASKAFQLRVARLGERLANKAFELYPDLYQRIGRFEFVIPDKSEFGTTSNASGTVAIFSGIRVLELSDPALAFILAREMGHVIGRHHQENTATRIIVAVLAQVLLPVSAIFHTIGLLPAASSAAAASATGASATAGATMATTTAASFLGSRVVIASYWRQQRIEADTLALTLIARLGFNPQDTADAMALAELRLDDGSWARDLRASSAHVAQIAQGPRLDKARLAQIAGSAPL